MRTRIENGKMGSETENNVMDPRQAKKLGTYLREARERAGLSQYRIAKTLQVPNTTIMRLERGENLVPRAELLAGVAEAIGAPLADVYALAGYDAPSELPTLKPYLRTKYRQLPATAFEELDAYVDRLAKKHGVDLTGPRPGEDETPEPSSRAKKKGGTSHATSKRTPR
jgi:transcriptional regulator with XRE-family HTH domain